MLVVRWIASDDTHWRRKSLVKLNLTKQIGLINILTSELRVKPEVERICFTQQSFLLTELQTRTYIEYLDFINHVNEEMKLSTKGEYGLLAAIDLALHSGRGPVQSVQIAERQEIPKQYLGSTAPHAQEGRPNRELERTSRWLPTGATRT